MWLDIQLRGFCAISGILRSSLDQSLICYMWGLMDCLDLTLLAASVLLEIMKYECLLLDNVRMVNIHRKTWEKLQEIK